MLFHIYFIFRLICVLLMVHSDGSDGSRTVTSFESYSVKKRSVQEKTTLPNIYLCKNPEHYLTRRQQDLCKENLYSFAASLQVRSLLNNLRIGTKFCDHFVLRGNPYVHDLILRSFRMIPSIAWPYDRSIQFFLTIQFHDQILYTILPYFFPK